jgi:hypothetical protein
MFNGLFQCCNHNSKQYTFYYWNVI